MCRWVNGEVLLWLVLHALARGLQREILLEQTTLGRHFANVPRVFYDAHTYNADTVEAYF